MKLSQNQIRLVVRRTVKRIMLEDVERYDTRAGAEHIYDPYRPKGYIQYAPDVDKMTGPQRALYNDLNRALNNEWCAIALVANSQVETGGCLCSSSVGDCKSANTKKNRGVIVSSWSGKFSGKPVKNPNAECYSFGLWHYYIDGGLGNYYLEDYGHSVNTAHSDQTSDFIDHLTDRQNQINWMVKYLKKNFSNELKKVTDIAKWNDILVDDIIRPWSKNKPKREKTRKKRLKIALGLMVKTKRKEDHTVAMTKAKYSTVDRPVSSSGSVTGGISLIGDSQIQGALGTALMMKMGLTGKTFAKSSATGSELVQAFLSAYDMPSIEVMGRSVSEPVLKRNGLVIYSRLQPAAVGRILAYAFLYRFELSRIVVIAPTPAFKPVIDNNMINQGNWKSIWEKRKAEANVYKDKVIEGMYKILTPKRLQILNTPGGIGSFDPDSYGPRSISEDIDLINFVNPYDYIGQVFPFSDEAVVHHDGIHLKAEYAVPFVNAIADILPKVAEGDTSQNIEIKVDKNALTPEVYFDKKHQEVLEKSPGYQAQQEKKAKEAEINKIKNQAWFNAQKKKRTKKLRKYRSPWEDTPKKGDWDWVEPDSI